MHRRPVAALAVLFALVVGLIPQVSAAQPSNEIESKSDIERAAARVEALAEKITEAKNTLQEAQQKLAVAYDRVSTAQRKGRAAKAAAESARKRATKTRREAEAAKARLRKTRKEVDNLASASLQLGNLESVRAYLGAGSVEHMLDRASLLESISESRADTLRDMRRASKRKAEKQAAAQAALEEAVAKRKKAEKAVEAATAAYEKARSREQEADQRAEKLIERKSGLQAQLERARQELTRLTNENQAAAATVSLSATARSVTAEVVAPANGTITSTYGPRGGAIHSGLDIANQIGTPVLSAMDGTVISSGPASGFGMWVRVRHDNGLVTVYGHIHESLVSVGQRVSAGQRIATIGNRGQSTGPHLHFEVHRSGSKIAPLTWLRSHGVSL